MKLFAVTLLGLIAVACANPVLISDNNIGDIITMNIEGHFEINSEITNTMVNVLLALLNQQAVLVGIEAGEFAADDYAAPKSANENEPAATPQKQEFKVTPEMIERLKSAHKSTSVHQPALAATPQKQEFKLTPEMVERFKSFLSGKDPRPWTGRTSPNSEQTQARIDEEMRDQYPNKL